MVLKTLAIRQKKRVKPESKETHELSPMTAPALLSGENFQADTQGEGSQQSKVVSLTWKEKLGVQRNHKC